MVILQYLSVYDKHTLSFASNSCSDLLSSKQLFIIRPVNSPIHSSQWHTEIHTLTLTRLEKTVLLDKPSRVEAVVESGFSQSKELGSHHNPRTRISCNQANASLWMCEDNQLANQIVYHIATNHPQSQNMDPTNICTE